MGKEIWATYYVFNSEDFLEPSLRCIIDYVDKVVVVDGAFANFEHDKPYSIDRTKEISEKVCGNKLIWVDCPKDNQGNPVAWIGEISKKNAGFSYVPNGAWMMQMADDEIFAGNLFRLFKEVRTTNKNCVWVNSIYFESIRSFDALSSCESFPNPPKLSEKWLKTEILERTIHSLDKSHLTWLTHKGPHPVFYRNSNGLHYAFHHYSLYDEKEKEVGSSYTSDDSLFLDYITEVNMEVLDSYDELVRKAKYGISIEENEDYNNIIGTIIPHPSEEIRPLLCIFSPRDIDFVKKAFDNIDYVDKLWIKYYPASKAYSIAENFFSQHKEYTHLIINCDDSAPKYEYIAMLIADYREYGFPVISACCCQDKLNDSDLRLNITFNQVTDTVASLYHHLPNDFRKLNGIIRVWFQGHALTLMRRDILEKVLLKPWKGDWAQDLRQSYEFARLSIPQYVDVRCYYEHFKIYNLQVGIKEPYISFVPATAEIPKVSVGKIVTKLPFFLRRLYINAGYSPMELKIAFSSFETETGGEENFSKIVQRKFSSSTAVCEPQAHPHP